MDIRIRPARAEDIGELNELNRRTSDPSNTPGPPGHEDADLFERIPPEDHLVAELDGRIVGYARIGHPTPLPASRHVAEINGLGVDPDVRGRGIGERLLRAVIDEARRRGAHKLSLRVMGSNPTAKRLYERVGFTVQGHLWEEFLVDGELVDDFMMAMPLTRPLSPADPAPAAPPAS